MHRHLSICLPTVRDLLTWLRDDVPVRGVEADAPGTAAEGLDSSQWTEFFLTYGPKGSRRESLTLGCYRDTGPGSTCAEMVRGQLETVAAYEDSPGQRRVLDVLSRTRFAIWCRVDKDSGLERASAVLDLMAGLLGRYGAVFHLQDEGFLADSDTPLCGWVAGDE